MSVLSRPPCSPTFRFCHDPVWRPVPCKVASKSVTIRTLFPESGRCLSVEGCRRVSPKESITRDRLDLRERSIPGSDSSRSANAATSASSMASVRGGWLSPMVRIVEPKTRFIALLVRLSFGYAWPIRPVCAPCRDSDRRFRKVSTLLNHQFLTARW